MDRIEKKKKEIEKLKKDLKLKKKIFELIKKDTIKAKELLKKDKKNLSYFLKFKEESITHKVYNYYFITPYLSNGFDVHFNEYHENEVLEDFLRLEKEIEEKENRLEQNIFLKKQKEFIDLQKNDLKEGKKDRKELNQFTFVLALGVLASVGFNFFQLLFNFFNATSTRLFFISGIFCTLFLLLILFILYSFKAKSFFSFLKTQWAPAVMILLVIIICIIGLVMLPNKPIIIDGSLENSINKLTETMNNQSITINSPIYLNYEPTKNYTKAISLNPKT